MDSTIVKKGQMITLTIEKAAFEGKGIGKVDGLAVFVPNTVPGDVVEARIIKKKKNYAEARLMKLLQPGEIRIKPHCKHFGVCGGCQWQHISYQDQLHFKRQQVEDHIRRIGGLPDVPVHPVFASEREFAYRNKMEFTFGDRRWLTNEEIASEHELQTEGFWGGMHAPGRFDRILQLDECFLMRDDAYQILNFTRTFAENLGLEAWNPVKRTGFLRNIMIRDSFYFDDLMVNLVTNGENPTLMDTLKTALLEAFPSITTIVQNVNDTPSPTSVGRYENVLYGSGFIRDKIGKYQFNIHPNAFFQTNTRQAEVLYEKAAQFADIQSDDILYDLYCGVGTLTLYLSQKAKKAVGIELNPVAIENAKQNAIDNQVENVFFELGDMKDTFRPELFDKYGRPDVLLIDPPRVGMHPDVVQELIQLKCPKIVYISCNSSTLARDLNLLKEIYDITDVQPVDMFPQTFHIESVTNLRLKV